MGTTAGLALLHIYVFVLEDFQNNGIYGKIIRMQTAQNLCNLVCKQLVKAIGILGRHLYGSGRELSVAGSCSRGIF